MTHLRINLKTVSVNLGPGCQLPECQLWLIIPFHPPYFFVLLVPSKWCHSHAMQWHFPFKHRKYTGMGGVTWAIATKSFTRFQHNFYSISAWLAMQSAILARALLSKVCLSHRHVPVFCPDEWRYDRAVFSNW